MRLKKPLPPNNSDKGDTSDKGDKSEKAESRIEKSDDKEAIKADMQM